MMDDVDTVLKDKIYNFEIERFYLISGLLFK